MNASISIPRATFDAVESLADAAARGVFSRTASQLIEVGLMALKCGWQPPPGWWPESGRQVPQYYGATPPPAAPGERLPGAEEPLGPSVAPVPTTPDPEPVEGPAALTTPPASELL